MTAELEVSCCFDFFIVLVFVLVAMVVGVVVEVEVDVDVVNSWQELSLSII